MRSWLAMGCLVVSGCGAAPNPDDDASGRAQACVPSGEAVAVGWTTLKNPILGYPDAAVKDLALRVIDGRWQAWFSSIVDNPFRFRVAHTSSADLSSWSEPPALWDDPALGGLASPDVTRAPDGDYVVAYNSHTRDVSGQPKLYARTSADARAWSDPIRLLDDLYASDDDRLIDAALAHTEIGVIAAFKLEQLAHLALSESGELSGPWRDLGEPDFEGLLVPSVENFQFLVLDEQWHLLVTTVPGHEPVLFALDGDAGRPIHWLRWRQVMRFSLPTEDWNLKERANAAFLCDARQADGHFYLFYAGSNELEAYQGRGHARIGVARTTDLTLPFEVPPG